jgi:ubiquinone/menaquinone biosynthesis C-methylase UbiE
MARIAKGRVLRTVSGVAEALPFLSGSFDVAQMVTTICLVDDIETALAESFRILHPGGSLLIGLVDRDSALGKHYERHKTESVFYEAATFYSVDEIIAHPKRVGFEHQASRQTVFSGPDDMRRVEPSAEGWGTGGFVVLRERKPGG